MRSIGKRWTKKVKEMITKAAESGIDNYEERFEYLKKYLPDEIWYTWESAYDEIHRLCWDFKPDIDKKPWEE